MNRRIEGVGNKELSVLKDSDIRDPTGGGAAEDTSGASERLQANASTIRSMIALLEQRGCTTEHRGVQQLECLNARMLDIGSPAELLRDLETKLFCLVYDDVELRAAYWASEDLELIESLNHAIRECEALITKRKPSPEEAGRLEMMKVKRAKVEESLRESLSCFGKDERRS
jgi:hypothetical protein